MALGAFIFITALLHHPAEYQPSAEPQTPVANQNAGPVASGQIAQGPIAPGLDADFGLGDDAKLEKAVDLNRPFDLLVDCVAQISKETGIPLAVSPSMKNLKVVLITGPNRPALKTLRDLADLFDANWREEESGGYRLSESPKIVSLRAARVERETLGERQETQNEFARLAKMAPQWGDDPSGQMQADWKVANDFPADDKEGKAAAWETYYKKWGKYGISHPNDRLLGQMAASLTDADFRRFQRGELIWASTDPTPGGRRLSKWRTETWDENGKHFDTIKDTYRAFLRLNVEQGKIEFAYAAEGPNSRSWSGSSNALNHGNGLTGTDPFISYLESWRTPITKGTDPILSTPARQGVPEGVSPWFDTLNPTFTLADQVARLNTEFGVPVVAEALRRTDWRKHKLEFGQADLRAALTAWFQGYYPPGKVRIARGALLFRPDSYWREREGEPDEVAARKLERAGGKALADYASAAANFTPQQALAAPGLAWKVDASPFSSPTLLRLWRDLTSGEQNTLLNGGVVRARPGLSLDRVFADAIFSGAIKGSMLRRFDGPEVRWDGLALYGSRGGVMQQQMVYDSQGYGSSGKPGTKTLTRETLVITVGESKDDGVDLSCNLPSGKVTPGVIKPFGQS